MPCYRPLQAWRGKVLSSGKRSVVFKRGDASPALSVFPHKLPCGQCVGCRLDYSLDWADRCLKESQMFRQNCFITLTYSPEFLPSDGSLDVREFQLFMKKFRARVGVPLRFYHAGEYGERFGRPHYHALIFGYDFPDRVFLKSTSSGAKLYSSALLSDIWGKGHCSVGDVTFESAAYVARYCMKKVTGKLRSVCDSRGLTHYERLDEVSGVVSSLKPEYVTMSRRPGIGFSWYQRFKSDVYPHDFTVLRGGKKMPPSRYFDSLYERENPLDMKRIKSLRSSRCGKLLDGFDDNDSFRLPVKEEVKLAEIRVLRRSLEEDVS